MKFILLYVLLLFATCKKSFEKRSKTSSQFLDSTQIRLYSKTINAEELKTHLYILAADSLEGRKVGSEGYFKAANYLKNYYKHENIPSPINDSIYFQEVSKSFLNNKYESSPNVLAYIKGKEFPEEVLIITAHLDHNGITKKGKVYNGADDDASGNAAIMEIAQAFNIAKQNGFGPRRSLLFLHVTAEEIGLKGSKYYTENPVFPLQNTIANLNIDMIGRIDKKHKNSPNYIYLIGSNRLSTQLHNISEKINEVFFNIKFDYTYNDIDDPNRYYYRSDHYNFVKHNIPVIFYFNGTHQDYHKTTDTADKIDYMLLEKRTQLIFATAWHLVNRNQRIIVDKTSPKQ